MNIQTSAIKYANKIRAKVPGYTLEKAKKIFDKYYYLVEEYYISNVVVDSFRKEISKNKILSPTDVLVTIKAMNKINEAYKKWLDSLSEQWRKVPGIESGMIAPFTVVSGALKYIEDRCIALDKINVTYFTPAQYMKYVDQYKHQARTLRTSGLIEGLLKGTLELQAVDNKLIELFSKTGYLIEKI